MDSAPANIHIAPMTIPPEPWPTGIAEQIEPLVRRVLAPNPSPFTYTGTESYIVGAQGVVAVIDPGPNEPAHLAALRAAIGDAEVAAICCTHTHRDHSPAAVPLQTATGAPVIGCAALVLDSTGQRSDDGFDATYTPDRVLRDGESLSGPDWTLTAVATPGHTSNHLCFALAESGALFTGDHVMGWSTTVIIPPEGDMAAYMASLDKLHRREDRVYYPAHGAPVDNPRQFVRGLIGHRRQRERQILKLLDDGMQGIEAELVPAMYKGTDRKLWPAAGRSVLAHLIDLEQRGMVRHTAGRWTING